MSLLSFTYFHRKIRCFSTELVFYVSTPLYSNAVGLDIIAYKDALYQSMSRWATQRNTTKDKKSHGQKETGLTARSKA